LKIAFVATFGYLIARMLTLKKNGEPHHKHNCLGVPTGAYFAPISIDKQHENCRSLEKKSGKQLAQFPAAPFLSLHIPLFPFSAASKFNFDAMNENCTAKQAKAAEKQKQQENKSRSNRKQQQQQQQQQLQH